MNTSQTARPNAKRARGRRRTYLINPAFQWKYAAAVFVSVLVVATLISHQLFDVLYSQARSRVLHPELANTWQSTIVFLASGIAFAAIVGAALSLWMIVVTHRICGPMYVIEGYLFDLIAGRFPKRRTLRKRDEFKGFHDVFWRTIDALKVAKRSEVSRVGELLNIAQSGAGGDNEQRKEALDSLAAHLKTMYTEGTCVLGEDPGRASETTHPGRQTASTPAKAYAEATV